MHGGEQSCWVMVKGKDKQPGTKTKTKGTTSARLKTSERQKSNENQWKPEQ